LQVNNSLLLLDLSHNPIQTSHLQSISRCISKNQSQFEAGKRREFRAEEAQKLAEEKEEEAARSEVKIQDKLVWLEKRREERAEEKRTMVQDIFSTTKKEKEDEKEREKVRKIAEKKGILDAEAKKKKKKK